MRLPSHASRPTCMWVWVCVSPAHNTLSLTLCQPARRAHLMSSRRLMTLDALEGWKTLSGACCRSGAGLLITAAGCFFGILLFPQGCSCASNGAPSCCKCCKGSSHFFYPTLFFFAMSGSAACWSCRCSRHQEGQQPLAQAAVHWAQLRSSFSHKHPDRPHPSTHRKPVHALSCAPAADPR